MATRKGTHISGHYVVLISVICLFIYVLCILKIERWDRIVFYIVFKAQRPPDTVLYVEFIPTAVSFFVFILIKSKTKSF